MALHGTFDVEKENPGRGSAGSGTHPLSPSAPPAVGVTPMLQGFAIDWAPPPSPIPIEGYRVYRRDDEGEAKSVGHATANVHSFFDVNVEPRHAYSYFVTAINFLGEGPPSEVVVGAIPDQGLTGSSG